MSIEELDNLIGKGLKGEPWMNSLESWVWWKRRSSHVAASSRHAGDCTAHGHPRASPSAAMVLMALIEPQS
jgi:hypothetical protein